MTGAAVDRLTRKRAAYRRTMPPIRWLLLLLLLWLGGARARERVCQLRVRMRHAPAARWNRTSGNDELEVALPDGARVGVLLIDERHVDGGGWEVDLDYPLPTEDEHLRIRRSILRWLGVRRRRGDWWSEQCV